MTKEFVFTFIGYFGTLCISLAYLVALSGKSGTHPRSFLWLNLMGGISLCFPTILAGTLVTHVLNGFWIIIALSSMLDHYSKGRRKVSERSLKLIALSAAFLVLVLGTQSMLNVENGSMVLMVASMISLLFFMGGYFYISLNPSQPKSIPLYLAICMTGNLLYIPILIKDGNWPIFWLQAFCFSAGMIKLLAIYFAVYLMSKKITHA